MTITTPTTDLTKHTIVGRANDTTMGAVKTTTGPTISAGADIKETRHTATSSKPATIIDGTMTTTTSVDGTTSSGLTKATIATTGAPESGRSTTVVAVEAAPGMTTADVTRTAATAHETAATVLAQTAMVSVASGQCPPRSHTK